MVLNFLKSQYSKFKALLAKTGSLLGQKIRLLFSGPLNEQVINQLEELFYEADLGVTTSIELTAKARDSFKKNPALTSEDLISVIRQYLLEILLKHPANLSEVPKNEGPTVVLIVGVNGNGKTTSVAKLAKRFKDKGQKVLIAGADTYRAAAMEQLEIWAQRLEIDMVKGLSKSDPAAVAFDAMSAAKARGCDVVIIDTAGRLHTKTHLMQELEKIRRSCKKFLPNSPHETLLVLDATTGQNAIEQAKTFHQFTPITGLILTKMDGTAKGGVIINIQRELSIPVKFIGVGEGIDDFEPFDPELFLSSLLS